MHDTTDLVEARIARFATERVKPAIYTLNRALTVTAWEVPDEPVPFEVARAAEFSPFVVGAAWGKPWGTTWFHVTGTVPLEWTRPNTAAEVLIDLGFAGDQPGFQAEGLVYDPNGTIVKAIEPFNEYIPVGGGPGAAIDFYIEAASNPNFASDRTYRPTQLGDKSTAGEDPLYALVHADVALLDRAAWELDRDIWTLLGLMNELDVHSSRRADILRALEAAVDATDPDDVANSLGDARRALEGVFSKPANASAHRVMAVGHAHIDSAWLWPVRETIRKCARTFSNVLHLMERHPELIFACSSAQQYAWMKEYYPQLFERIRARVAEGRFVPVGGMWVESDTNLPGGEALARQFIAGKRFFMREFGIEPLEVWLPDSFGYSAALPQIVSAAGSKYFLTQKTSWNETNRMPHHTFQWEGIDGTRVFTHFPPVDTYNSELSGGELARAERQYSEKGFSDLSLVPFGWGNGGGGPTREMLAAATRNRNLEGAPRVEIATPKAFFDAAVADYPNPPIWSGELYLEFHRGTYTSQARTKRGNRRSEHLLREAELWSSTASVRGLAEYPYEELGQAWEIVLLQQFHDILPGSSIAWVHKRAESNYALVAQSLEKIIAASMEALAGVGDQLISFNASPYPVTGMAALAASEMSTPRAATLTNSGAGHVLENEFIAITLDSNGLITSIIDRERDREVIPSGTVANLLQVYRDTPNQWDAWDIDAHYLRHSTPLRDIEDIEVLHRDDATGLRIRRKYGSSTFVQDVLLASGSRSIELTTTVDWHERQKLLKLAFPLNVHADRSASEIQFGHIFRPTHANTSWDVARFETSAHRWVHVSEPGFGVAIANDSTYGHDITRQVGPDGLTSTLVRESLLRSPLYPDPQADQGEHTLRTSIAIGADILDAVAEGYRLNLPSRPWSGNHSVEPIVRVSNPAVVVESVKLAEDRSGDVVIRLYEALGASSTAIVTPSFVAGAVVATDLLERTLGDQSSIEVEPDGSVMMRLRAFQILTLRFTTTPGGNDTNLRE